MYTNDQKVTFKAKINNIHTNRNGMDIIVLEDVYINDEYFRDHLHIKNTKRFNEFSVGDSIVGDAKIYLYHSCDSPQIADKIGLKNFRNLAKP